MIYGQIEPVLAIRAICGLILILEAGGEYGCFFKLGEFTEVFKKIYD